MILHRYIKYERGLDIIKNLRLHLSDPFKLNDPFEFKVAFAKPRMSDLEEQLHSQNYIDRLYEKSPINNKEKFTQLYKEGIQDPNIRKGMLKDNRNTFRKRSEDIQKKHFKTMRILCFTSPEKTNNEEQQKYDEILMWSHYAKSHEGLRFHFEKNEFDFINTILEEINYENERCKIYPFKSDTWIKALRDSLITKCKAWEYENEYRYFISTMECKKEKDNYYIDIPPKSIKRIDIGLKCSKSVQNQVIKLIREKNELHHVDLFKANIHENKYELIYDKLQVD